MPRPDRALAAALRERARAAAREAARVAGSLSDLAWPPRQRHAAALLAAAVAGLGVHGLFFQLGLGGRLPSDLDWRAAAAVLSRAARPGDAVAISPWWAERARLALPAGLPVLTLPRYAGEELLGVRRVWLLSLPEAPGAGDTIARDLAARAAAAEPPQRLGSLELSRYDLAAPALARAFLPDLVAAAQVTTSGEECPASGPLAFRCGPVGVAREVREVAGGPRPCIAVQGGPGPVEIAFGGVPLAGRLRGHAGLVGSGPPGPAVKVELEAAGATAALELADLAWHPLEVDTSAAEGQAGEVLIRVTAATDRPLCVDAWVAP